jgi:phosphoribosylformylglycinamidine synthase
VSGVPVDLTEDEIKSVVKTLGRTPNSLEIGMIDIMFSEHCSYKSSRPILKLFPTTGPRVVVGPGYDAGVVDVGSGWCVNLKMESHNHPSAIDPYNGAATGVGGMIRDVLCQGARPIALLNSLRFGPLDNPHSRWLLKYVAKGAADYGNYTGVPTVAGEVEFDKSFETNCLVNVACVGLVEKKKLVLAKATRPGDLLVLVGGSTGRDGIHGVTFASKTLTEEKSEEDRPASPAGDPFMKKRLIEAILKIVETGYISGLKDLGGGGLTCAASEMAAKGGCGAEIDVSKVPLSEKDMTPYEIMLSESQERMLLIVEENRLEEVLSIFDKYEVPHAIIGRVTDSGNLVVKDGEKILASVPAKLLSDPPVIQREARKPDYLDKLRNVDLPPMPNDLTNALYRILSSPNVASKEWLYSQCDYEVGIRTILKHEDADAAVRGIPNGKAIALTTDCNSRHCYLDPYNGGAGAVAEACRNVVATGGEPLAIVDCCNFGNPENPEVFWQFKEAVRGMADMCKGLSVPCVGGNVSFYNEDGRTGKAVKPCPGVVALGLIDNLDSITPMPFQNPGDVIVMVGETFGELGGSEYYHVVHGLEGGNPPKADPARERKSIDAVLAVIKKGHVRSAHDCSRGGLGVALATMAIKSGLGATIELEKVPSQNLRPDELLFSETHSRFILTTRESDVGPLADSLEMFSIPFARIGNVSNSDSLAFKWHNADFTCSIHEMRKKWEGTIPKYMEGTAE